MSGATALLMVATEAPPPVDAVTLNFDEASLLVLNVILGFIMFGIALDVRISDVRDVIAKPLAPTIGVGAQFLLLPAFTFALTQVIDPAPSIALGMILVGSCPGGNISNFITHLARGNTMLSIGMTGISTMAAAIMTPVNFSFWGSLDADTDALLRTISLDPVQLIATIALLLGLPVAAGMTLQARRPELADRLYPHIRRLSIAFFVLFVVIAFANNFQHFLDYIGLVVFAVLVHNGTALALGYGSGLAARLEERDRRALAIEIGIQNSALALVLIFSFFDGLGGMALVAAWWGIWHIISGLALATVWGRGADPLVGDEAAAA